jgi:hypothetical protein
MRPSEQGKTSPPWPANAEGVPLTVYTFEADAHLDVARRPGPRQNEVHVDITSH